MKENKIILVASSIIMWGALFQSGRVRYADIDVTVIKEEIYYIHIPWEPGKQWSQRE